MAVVPEIALVTDMSGECRAGATPHTTLYPAMSQSVVKGTSALYRCIEGRCMRGWVYVKEVWEHHRGGWCTQEGRVSTLESTLEEVGSTDDAGKSKGADHGGKGGIG